MALTTLAAVRTSMQYPAGDTADNAFISALIPAVDALIKKWLGRNLEYVTGLVEYLDGNHTQMVYLREPPVIAADITGVYFDPNGAYGQGPSAFAAGTALTRGTDYVLKVDQPDGVTSRSGILVRINGTWGGGVSRTRGRLASVAAPGRGNIKVTYSGGYATVPAQVTEAANKMIARMLAMGPEGIGLTSESFEGRSVSVDLGQSQNMLFTPEVSSALWPFKLKKYAA